MVKNLHGGNKSKSKARTTAPAKFRPATEEGERYAVITKLYGGGRCDVKCIDDVVRTCIIRSRFNRERASIRVGAWVLVGDRSFETRNNVCDLLEVYSDSDKTRLQDLPGNWNILRLDDSVEGDDNIVFTEHTEPTMTSSCVITLDEVDVDEI